MNTVTYVETCNKVGAYMCNILIYTHVNYFSYYIIVSLLEEKYTLKKSKLESVILKLHL